MSPIVNSTRERRVLLGGIVCISLVLLVGRGLPAWQRWQGESRNSASILAEQVASARASMARSRLTHDSLAARQRRFLALAPLLLRGETLTMGGATLASIVSTAATASSVRLGPMQVHADTATHDVFSRVRVRAQLTGDVRGVGAFLSAIERGPPRLAVREMAISQPEPGAPPERAEALHVDLTVEALMLTPRSEKPHAAGSDSVKRTR